MIAALRSLAADALEAIAETIETIIFGRPAKPRPVDADELARKLDRLTFLVQDIRNTLHRMNAEDLTP